MKNCEFFINRIENKENLGIILKKRRRLDLLNLLLKKKDFKKLKIQDGANINHKQFFFSIKNRDLKKGKK